MALSSRERIITIIVLAACAVFVIDRVAIEPYFDQRQSLKMQLKASDQKLEQAETIFKREKHLRQTLAELSGSIKTGLSALPVSSGGAMILLGDMPEVEARDLKLLMGAFEGREAICIPVRDGRRGNPVLWGASYFAEMMGLSGDVGAKQLIAKHQAHVTEVPVGSDGIFADVDTPADLARLGASSAAKP